MPPNPCVSGVPSPGEEPGNNQGGSSPDLRSPVPSPEPKRPSGRKPPPESIEEPSLPPVDPQAADGPELCLNRLPVFVCPLNAPSLNSRLEEKLHLALRGEKDALSDAEKILVAVAYARSEVTELPEAAESLRAAQLVTKFVMSRLGSAPLTLEEKVELADYKAGKYFPGDNEAAKLYASFLLDAACPDQPEDLELVLEAVARRERYYQEGETVRMGLLRGVGLPPVPQGEEKPD